MTITISKVDGPGEDLDNLLDIYCIANLVEGKSTMNKKAIMKLLEIEYGFENKEYFIARKGTTPIGSILYSKDPFLVKKVLLDNIYVLPRYRKKGYGKSMSDQTQHILFQEGYQQLKTEKIFFIEEKERDLLEYLGFTIVNAPMELGSHASLDLTKPDSTSTSSPSSTSLV